MNGDFFIDIERLELISFFAAYPLVYLLIHFITGSFRIDKKSANRLKSLLPYAYGLAGLAFIGYQLMNLYPDFSFQHIKNSTGLPVLKSWALVSPLFLIPLFAKNPVFSFLHSLVFFFLLAQDLFYQLSGIRENLDIVRNDMKLFTDSLLLQTGAFLIVIAVAFLLKKLRSAKKETGH